MELNRKKFTTDTLLSSFPLIAGPLSGFIIMIFITKFIGTEGYGIWSQFQVTFSLLALFLCLNFGRSIPRFLGGEKDKQYLSKVFYSALTSILIFTVLISLIFYGLKEPFANFLFGSKELGIIVTLLIFFLIFRNLNRQSQHILMAQRYVKEWSLINLGIFIFTAGLISFISIVTQNIITVITTFVVIEGFIFGILLGFVWKKGIKPVKPSFSSISPLLKFGVPLIITSIGYWIIQSSDRYLIKYFMDISQVGLYSMGYSSAFVLMSLWITFRSVLLPDLSVLFDEGKIKELEIRFGRVLKYGLAFSIPAVLGLSILAVPIIKTLSSEAFLPATKVLSITAITVFFYGIFIHFNTLLDLLKKVKVLNSIWAFIAIFNLILNFWFIPKFGIEGAAYSTLLSFLIGTIIIVLYSKNYFKIVFKKEWFIKIVIASTLMSGTINLITITSSMYLILTILIGVLIYGSVLFLLKFYDKSELLLLKDTLKINHD